MVLLHRLYFFLMENEFLQKFKWYYISKLISFNCVSNEYLIRVNSAMNNLDLLLLETQMAWNFNNKKSNIFSICLKHTWIWIKSWKWLRMNVECHKHVTKYCALHTRVDLNNQTKKKRNRLSKQPKNTG